MNTKKFFKEMKDKSHLDIRYGKDNLSQPIIHSRLKYLLKETVLLFTKVDIPCIIMHGSLIGWYFGEKMLPWDDDIDLHVWAKDLKNNPNFETDEYIWFVVPTAHSEEIDKLNGIDARLISKKYGLFVDIMALHPKKDYDIIKHESVGGEKKRKRKILPFLKVKFGDIKCNVANDYMNDLQFLYGNNCLTHDLHGKRLNLPIVEKPI